MSSRFIDYQIALAERTAMEAQKRVEEMKRNKEISSKLREHYNGKLEKIETKISKLKKDRETVIQLVQCLELEVAPIPNPRLNNQFWVLRQNHAEKTDQPKMKAFILSQQFVTCPWGDHGKPRENVINGVYNDRPEEQGFRSSNGQDRVFVEKMKIGDIVLIPFTKGHGFILARIISDVIYSIDTGFNRREQGKKILIDKKEGGVPFRPVGRKIEIIREIRQIDRTIPRWTLTKMTRDLIDLLNRN